MCPSSAQAAVASVADWVVLVRSQAARHGQHGGDRESAFVHYCVSALVRGRRSEGGGQKCEARERRTDDGGRRDGKSSRKGAKTRRGKGRGSQGTLSGLDV